MVSLYSGTPRSGKSLHAAERILAWSRLGCPVIANFPCNLKKYKKAKFTYCPNDQLTPEFLYRFSEEYFQDKPRKESAILVVIDECQLLFNALQTKKNGRLEWLRFFSLHGKLGYDVILIAQNDRMVDRQIRGVIEYEFVHRKLSNFGMQGILLRLFTLGANFFVVQRWYPIKQKISHYYFRGGKRLYTVYDTFVLFDSKEVKKIEDSKEKFLESSEKIANAPKRPKGVILLRSFCLAYSTKPTPNCQYPAPSFWRWCTMRIHVCTYCFCCVGNYRRCFYGYYPLDCLFFSCYRFAGMTV